MVNNFCRIPEKKMDFNFILNMYCVNLKLKKLIFRNEASVSRAKKEVGEEECNCSMVDTCMRTKVIDEF